VVEIDGIKYKLVKENPTWFKKKDIITPDNKGYIRRRINGKMRRLHVVLMEQKIGRKLNQVLVFVMPYNLLLSIV
jgi:hypothetical protein